MSRRILVTGASGYVGRLLVESLATDADLEVVATDIRMPEAKVPGAIHEVLDITDAGAVAESLKRHQAETVVHLAAIVTPNPDQGRAFQYAVDVEGTRNVVEACLAAGVSKLVYTSSGAAYGYHPENGCLLDEEDPLRGNDVFAYSCHKRLVEEMLATYRADHPELSQLIFRVSTVLGPRTRNQITALFERPVVLGIRDVDTPFCFVSDADVVGCLAEGVRHLDKSGVFNLTGDGVMTLREIAGRMGRRYVALPEKWIEKGLKVLSERSLTQYGPEQVLFLRYRPVMANERLKRDFGYRPRASREVFDVYANARA